MQLGVKEVIASPTFSLINTYQSANGPIYHFDFYRLQNPNEALDIGIEEYLESGNLCLIEWGEKIENTIGDNYDKFKIIKKGTLRIIEKTK